MVKHSEYSDKKITVTIMVDRISDSGYYLSEGGDLRYLDECVLKSAWHRYRDAKMKGNFVKKFTAVSGRQVTQIRKELNAEVDYLYNKLPKIPNGGAAFFLNSILKK
jgi:hypothetical protein